MIKKDYIMNQLEMLVRIGAKIIFRDTEGRESILIFNSQTQGLDRNLLENLVKLAEEGRIDEAENLLFREVEEKRDVERLNTAIRFYSYLNSVDGNQLKHSGFSKEEIRDGFSDICALYGIVDILF